MKEEIKNIAESNEEKAVRKPDIKPSGDIDDFIFEGEAYRCSEK